MSTNTGAAQLSEHAHRGGCCGHEEGASCGLGQGPALDAYCSGQVAPARGTDGVKASFRVVGLDCAEEVRLLESAVGPLVGGKDKLAFDLVAGRMMILEGAREVAEREVLAAVRKAGLEATPEEAGRTLAASGRLRLMSLATAASGALWLLGMVLHFVNAGGLGAGLDLFAGHGPKGLPLGERLLFGLSAATALAILAPRALSALRGLRPDMHLLVTIATLGALVIDEWFEAAAVSFLFALSLVLERWSVGRARRAIAALLDLTPPRARVKAEDGSTREVPVAEVRVGETILVLPGERIPLDGRVAGGGGAVDQAPITGESVPVAKEAGDAVYAGTIALDGALEIRVEKAASDTLLARIIRMVEEAQGRRARVEQFVERFARIYTPLVLVLALLMFLVPPLAFGEPFDVWFYRALILLVLACPCALVVSTPVSIVSGIAAAARNGVLVKGGTFLEQAAKLKTVAFEKTGTLTLGAPELVAVVPLTADERAALELSAALEAKSTHPLALAVQRAAAARGLRPPEAREVQARAGRGVEGEIEGRRYWLGSPRWASEQGVELDRLADRLAELEAAGQTPVLLGEGPKALAILALADRPRPEAKAALEQLHRLGVRHLVMLTGDRSAAAAAIARELGLDEVRAELLPEDKLRVVEELVRTRGPAAMVGDGINDAPALARADLAVAMGAIGTDVAIETADVALMTDRLDRLPWLVGHGRRVLQVISVNITFALAVKALFVALTAFGWATLWGAILADVGATLLVTLNALRLLAHRGPREAHPTLRAEPAAAH